VVWCAFAKSTAIYYALLKPCLWATPAKRPVKTTSIYTPLRKQLQEEFDLINSVVDGTLYMCPGQEHRFELRPLLRNGITDEKLKQTIRQAVDIKPERHFFTENPEKPLRFMSVTGV